MAGLNSCRNCHHSLTEGEQFCGHCGTRVSSTAFEPTMTPMFCSQCGSPFRPGYAFCSNCGTSRLLEEEEQTVPARKPIHLAEAAVDPSAPTIADDFVVNIPLQTEDLEPDFAELSSKPWWYERNLRALRVHIDNHDFCSKVEEIAAKTAREIKSSETNMPEARDKFLRNIKEITDEFPLTLHLYWANLSKLVAKALIEMVSLYGDQNAKSGVKSIAKMSLERIFKHAHFRLAFYLSPAISPDSAEKFGFPDIAAYMRRYEEYCQDNEYGDLKAVAEIYTGEKYESKPESWEEPYGFRRATFMAREDRPVAHQKLYISRNWFIPTRVSDMVRKEDAEIFSMFGGLEEHIKTLIEELKVSKVIEKDKWCVYCLPQILISRLCYATFNTNEPIEALEYESRLNRDDYDEIRG